MTRGLSAIAALILLIVLFVVVNVLASAGLRGVRVDLTDGKLYTLSEGSRSIAASVDEPIRLTLYLSESLATGNPLLKTFGQRVRELLEEYERASGGSIRLTVVDPEPYSEAEDEAALAGIRGRPVGPGQAFYFGLVGTNSTDGREVIPAFDPQNEQFLEYEVSQLIYLLANPDRPVVGVLSSLPLMGSPGNRQMGMRGAPPWAIGRTLATLFETRPIDPSTSSIPDDIDLLAIIHPKGLSPAMSYAIDQFVLGGGPALICVDPLCEADVPPGAQQNPMMLLQAQRDSDLPELFETWGVRLEDGEIAGDLDLGRQVGLPPNGEPATYIAWMGLDERGINPTSPVTGRLTSISVATAGILAREDNAPTEWEPLLTTTGRSTRIPADQLRLMPDVKALLSGFEASGKELVLGAMLTGNVPSSFPNGPPAPTTGDTEGPSRTDHLTTSTEPIRVVLLADVDMLTDRFWVQRGFLGLEKFADNGDLIANAIDSLTGSTDLMNVRARAKYRRPFDRVESIQRDAELEYRAREEELQQELTDAETRLNELQRERADGGNSRIMTPEQQAELEKFQEARAETRRELRAVQLNLRKDVERLGTILRVINIGLMPAIVALGAIGLGLYRGARRSADHARLTPPASSAPTASEDA